MSNPIYKPLKAYHSDINDLIDADNFIAKGKALPVGTRRTYSGVEHEKMGSGQWVPVSSGKAASKEEPAKTSSSPPKPKSQPSAESSPAKSGASTVEKLEALRAELKADGQKHGAKAVDAKIKELSSESSSSEAKTESAPEAPKETAELSSPERTALGLYQGDSNYGNQVKSWIDVQKVARGETLKTPEAQAEAERHITNLSRAIGKSPLAKDTKVYRGTSLPKETLAGLKAGSEMSDPGFTSTSKKKSVAENYSHADANFTGNIQVMFEMDLPKGTKGFDFQNMKAAFSDLNEEQEVVLDRNTKFKIDSVKESNGQTVIKLSLLS